MKPISSCIAVFLTATAAGHAATIAGFGDGSAFTLNKNGNGAASTITAGTLILTTAESQEARSVYATAKQDITSFTTTFRYDNGTDGGGADGFTFIIQNTGLNAIGNPGGARGFGGIGTASVAIAFNIFQSDNTSVGSDGVFQSLLVNENTNPTTLLDLADISITYNGTNLSYTVTNVNNTAQTITRNVNVDIPAIVGANTAWVGFTGGTGGTVAQQTLSNFNFASPVPEPSAALLGAVGAMFLLRRRRA